MLFDNLDYQPQEIQTSLLDEKSKLFTFQSLNLPQILFPQILHATF